MIAAHVGSRIARIVFFENRFDDLVFEGLSYPLKTYPALLCCCSISFSSLRGCCVLFCRCRRRAPALTLLRANVFLIIITVIIDVEGIREHCGRAGYRCRLQKNTAVVVLLRGRRRYCLSFFFFVLCFSCLERCSCVCIWSTLVARGNMGLWHAVS